MTFVQFGTFCITFSQFVQKTFLNSSEKIDRMMPFFKAASHILGHLVVASTILSMLVANISRMLDTRMLRYDSIDNSHHNNLPTTNYSLRMYNFY